MDKKRVQLGDFEVYLPKGYERLTDKDEKTDYLYINAPREIYTIYFDSGMPLYEKSVLNGYEESSSLKVNLPDRKIVFFCPSIRGDRKDGLWYFNIEFSGEKDEVFFLPGQIFVNSDEVYKRTIGGKLPFVEILEKIKLKTNTDKAV